MMLLQLGVRDGAVEEFGCFCHVCYEEEKRVNKASIRSRS